MIQLDDCILVKSVSLPGVELVCGDGVDNDGDQLLDCDDPDCCNTTVCMNDDSCSSAPDPSDLVGNTTANTTLSFYETIEFLFTSGLQMEFEDSAIDTKYDK